MNKYCGCYYCLEIYPVSEIDMWVDNGNTPVCPYCFIDAVLIGEVDVNTLERLHDEKFGETNA
jgi:hypothetical protein